MSDESDTPTGKQPGTWDGEYWICDCPPGNQYNTADSTSCHLCRALRPWPRPTEAEPTAVQLASDFLDQPSSKVETSNLVEMILRKAEDIEDFHGQVKEINRDYYVTSALEQAARSLRSAVGHAMKIKKS